MPSAYVTVSAKIRRELKEEAERLGIDFSEVIRRAIEEEVRRRKVEAIKRELDQASEFLDRISIEDIVRIVRESRDSR